MSNPSLRLLALVDLLLVWKIMAVGNATTLLRFRRRTYASPEDYALHGAAVKELPDEVIERSRRAHLNDLENILPFFAVSAIYALTAPPYGMLASYLWGFLIARTAHSVFYLRAMQPHRSIAFAIGELLMFAMSIDAITRLF